MRRLVFACVTGAGAVGLAAAALVWHDRTAREALAATEAACAEARRYPRSLRPEHAEVRAEYDRLKRAAEVEGPALVEADLARTPEAAHARDLAQRRATLEARHAPLERRRGALGQPRDKVIELDRIVASLARELARPPVPPGEGSR